MVSVGQNPTDQELADMIRIADADGTGDVDFAGTPPPRPCAPRHASPSPPRHPTLATCVGECPAEFVTLMAHKMADEKSEDNLRSAFAVFDTTGDGYISADEMRRIMINVGEPVTLEDVERLIERVDIDGDGQISYEEFTRVVIEEKASQLGLGSDVTRLDS